MWYNFNMSEKDFVDRLEIFFQQMGYITKRELDVGYGVADLVLFKLNPEKCLIRYKNKQFKRLDSEQYFRIFELLPDENSGRSISFERIIENVNVSKTYLKYKILKRLEEDGFIKKMNNDFYVKINGWMPLAEEIIAIEAKLKDWRRGVIQANRYKSFAHKSYLAMPPEKGHIIDRQQLKKYNIGLMLFNAEETSMQSMNRVKKQCPTNIYKYNFATEFILQKQILKNQFAN